MAYMDEMALEREKSKQALLAGKQPLLGDDSVKAMHALGVNLGLVPPGTPPSAMTQLLESFVRGGPKGIHVDNPRDLQVSPVALNRTPSTDVNRYSDGGSDLGSTLSGLFKGAKGGALDQMRKKLEAERGAASISDRIRNKSYATPKLGEPGAPAVAEAIPGLKPGFDASKLPPGSPAAVAYMHEHAPGGAVTGVEKGVTPAGYKADLDYLAEHGGHASKLVDGKITSVHPGEAGSYGQVNPEFAARLRAAGEAYTAATGQQPKYGELSRGADVQKIYRDKYEAGTGGIAAKPGASQHQQGSAGDLPSSGFRSWLNEGNQDKFGLHFPVKGDAPHVQANPAFKGTLAKPSGPPVPAWDKGLPAQPDPKTNWPSPSETTPADTLKAEPPAGVPGPQSSVETKGTSTSTDFSARRRTPPEGAPTQVANAPAESLVPSEILPGGQSGGGALAQQRAPYKAQADANPSMRETMAAIMIAEDGSPEGRQGVAEAMMNRVNATGRPFADAMDPNYHADYMVKDPAKFQSRLAEIRNNPKLKAEMYALQDKAFAGSNVTNLATDYASGSTAAKEHATPTFTSTGGSQFFRKDINPGDHGPANVANIQKWKAQTEAALKNPQGAAAPVASPQDVGSQSATMRDAVGGYLASKGVPGAGGAGTVSTPAPATSGEGAKPGATATTVFDKGTAAVPVSGVGGLQDPDTEAATTATTLYPDADTAAVNAIKPPEAAVPPAAAAAVTAPPPQPAARVMTPPPAPPPAAVAATPPPPARPAAPPPAPNPPPAATGVSAAHQLLDTNMKVLAQKFAPDRIPLMTQMGIDKQTLRQALGNTMSGNAIREGITPHLEKQFGVKPADFDRAYREPAPGKRADAGTSDATDFSARSRTPMAPPGLDGKVPTPQARPEGAPPPQQGQQPQVTPEMAKALENAFKDEARVPQAPPPPPEALPVQPVDNLPQGVPGGPQGGLSLAPGGLSSVPSNAYMPATAGSQGGSIATAGLMPLPSIENSTYSTPLLNSVASNNSTFGSSSLSPIPWQTLGSWGWGGSGGSGFGSSLGGGGFDFGGGGGMVMPEMSFGAGG